MDEFVYRLIKDKKIKFQSGNFSMFGFPNHLLPLTTLTTFFHILKNKYGDSVDNILKNVGEKQVKAMVKVLLPSSGPLSMEKVNLLLRYLGLFGYGDIKIANVNNTLKQVIFQLNNSPFCSMHHKLFGAQEGEIKPFIGGICQGMAELILERRMKSEETHCIAKHKESCYIVTSEDQEKESDPVMSKYTNNILKEIKKQELPDSRTELIEKLIGHQMIGWKEGIFSVWNIPGYIFPTPSLVFLNKALEERFGKGVNNILYHLGRVQARNAVSLQAEMYGFKKDKKLMLLTFEHSELAGFGLSKLEKVDFEKQTATVKGLYNPYLTCGKEIFGESNAPFDYYFAGLVTGVVEGIFGTPMEAKGTMCVAEGNPYCLYEVSNRESKTNYEIDEKDMRIIEEKINPKNLVT